MGSSLNQASAGPRQGSIFDTGLRQLRESTSRIESLTQEVHSLFWQCVGMPDKPPSHLNEVSTEPSNIAAGLEQLNGAINRLQNAIQQFRGD